MRTRIASLFLLVATLAFTSTSFVASADDWPTYQHDNRRSGVTEESLKLPLEISWEILSDTPPQNAWEGPAKWDAYSTQTDLKSLRNFDPAFFVTAVGDRVYFGSSIDDAVHCLDAKTGEERWVFYADGPVRLPPSIDKEKAYFGSDDGHAYCVDAKDGRLIWKYQPAKRDRVIPYNGKLVSLYPVRTGVLVKDGKAYFGASLLPWYESYVCAVDAANGSLDGEGLYSTQVERMVIQGAFLASGEHLYALQGRSAPVVFSRDTGARRGTVQGDGGTYALITEDDNFISGSDSQKRDRFRERDEQGRDQLASYEGANRIVVDGGIAYLQAKNELSAFDRKRYMEIQGEIFAREPKQQKAEKQLKELKKKLKDVENPDPALVKQQKELTLTLKTLKAEMNDFMGQLPDCFLWRVECAYPHTLIKAGKTVFAGGTDSVIAVDSKSGKTKWEQKVDGAVHGLTVAHGRLYVSTDKGHIYCFTKS